MIRYTGNGNLNSIAISLFGDGTSTGLMIDLEKAPFNLDFKQNYPAFFAASSTPGPIYDITAKSGKLTFAFSEPLPEASLELKGPSFEISLRFIYGVELPPTPRKKNVQHK